MGSDFFSHLGATVWGERVAGPSSLHKRDRFPNFKARRGIFCDVHWGAEALDAKDRAGLRVGGMANGWVGGLSFKLVQNSTLPTMSNDPLPVSKDHPHPGRDPPDFFGRLARPVHGSIFWVFGPKNPVSNDRTA